MKIINKKKRFVRVPRCKLFYNMTIYHHKIGGNSYIQEIKNICFVKKLIELCKNK